MNGRDGIGDHRLFNADRMLITTNNSVVASWMIFMMTDGRVLLTVVHQSSPEHRFLPVKGEDTPRRHRMRWLNTTAAIVTQIRR